MNFDKQYVSRLISFANVALVRVPVLFPIQEKFVAHDPTKSVPSVSPSGVSRPLYYSSIQEN
jgi:hypothetical protein